MSGTEMLLVGLTIVNLVLLIVVLVAVGRGPKGGDGTGANETRELLRAANSELRQDLATQRTELTGILTDSYQQLDARVEKASSAQTEELAREREARTEANQHLNRLLNESLTGLSDRLHRSSQSTAEAHNTLKASLEERFSELRTANDKRFEDVRETLSTQIEKLREGNEKKLEQMRATVDEKLQGTLEKRLGESFSLVSERLEKVQKGLGEMQTLATDVGGLKRVLTNVKTRGGWGEVQLARQLEDVLTDDQYEANVQVNPQTRESVEFAIKLPGRGEYDSTVYLPIDSKFPQEDYDRLLEAQELGDKDEVATAVRNVERVILTEAKRISEKYVHPPHSTDFAVMYLPTEGLFAEVVRIPGLISRLQREYRITVTGPTTLMSLLNSLQMGFRTLAIEKRSSEVWQVLSAAKHEFEKYGEVWKKLERQLQTAQNTVHQAGVRTRSVTRKLQVVEDLDLETKEGQALSQIFGSPEEIELEEAAEAQTSENSVEAEEE